MSPSLKISDGLGAVVNLDFIAAFAVGGCKLAIPALEKFTVHMSIPPMLAMTVILAYMTSLLFLSCKCCTKDNEYRIKMTNVRKQTSIKIVMFVAQIMYPGLATRIFSIYRCRTVAFSLHDSIEVFNMDYNIPCHIGEHASFEVVAAIFMVVYVAGVPAVVLFILLSNHQHLHKETRQTVIPGVAKRSRVSRWTSFIMWSNEPSKTLDVVAPPPPPPSRVQNQERRSSLSRAHSGPSPRSSALEEEDETQINSELDRTPSSHLRESRHHAIKYQYGALYSQYERDYFWFELVILLMKMTMTGAMCVIEPGSPVQLLYATLIMTMYMLVVLKS